METKKDIHLFSKVRRERNNLNLFTNYGISQKLKNPEAIRRRNNRHEERVGKKAMTAEHRYMV